MEVAPSVYLVSGITANPYLIVEESGITLIDSGLPNNANKILRYIESLNYRPEDLKTILITHSDIDHVGSLKALRRDGVASVAASAVEAEAIENGKPSREIDHSGVVGALIHAASSFFKAQPAKVDVILQPGEDLPILGGLQVIPTPGHTPGHISFWSPSTRILFSGDSIQGMPNRLLPSQGRNNWDWQKSVESYRLQANLHPAVVLGGHGWTDQNVEEKFAAGLQTLGT